MRISAEGSDECKIAAKTILTEKESSESFNITVPIQLFPLASVTVRWAVLVGDTDEKGSSLWCRAVFSVLARTFFEIALLAKNPCDIVLLMKTLFDIVRFAETPSGVRVAGGPGAETLQQARPNGDTRREKAAQNSRSHDWR